MMNNVADKEAFSYTYSAKMQEEVKCIRDKYIPKEEDKMEQLRRLDASVAQKGTVVSLVIGIISTLLLGLGMSCCMVWGDTLFLVGIFVGAMGIAGVIGAYPLYSYLVKKERERITPEILHLSEELMNGDVGIKNP